ncbi:MAG TPA: hypothetical protein VMU42_00820, partial [Candidatus Sulfotelmatobacter sp.]|nr:hypothetical protein [Candidatus Sulfotelmatobacter sp.]
LAALCALALCTIAPPALADALEPIPDPLLRELLNGLTIISQRQDPLSVRIIVLKHFGACDGGPDPLSCPTQDAFVAVSETGQQFPQQKLYRLPPGFGWHFVDWKSVPKSLEDPKSFIVFQMKQDTIAKAAGGDSSKSGYVWGSRLFEVGVNLASGYVQAVQ